MQVNGAEKPGSGSSQPLYFSKRGSGPPLLLVHGLMVTGEMFEPVIDFLAKRHQLIIPAAVLGYSMGGAIAQQFVLDNPQRCNQLVLASTYTYDFVTLGEKLAGRLFPFLVRLLGMRRFAKLVSSGTRQLSKERSDWLVGLIAAQNLNLMLSALRETLIRFDSRPRLREIKCPTLIVAGSLDRGDVRQAKMLHDGISGSHLTIISNADHALIWAHTDEFVRSVEEFLKG